MSPETQGGLSAAGEDQPIRSPLYPVRVEGSAPTPIGVFMNRDDIVNGYYGSCHRCHEPQTALFRRPFFGSTEATWDLCRGCIASLGLERPVVAFDLPEVEEESSGARMLRTCNAIEAILKDNESEPSVLDSSWRGVVASIALTILIGSGVTAVVWTLCEVAVWYFGR